MECDISDETIPLRTKADDPYFRALQVGWLSPTSAGHPEGWLKDLGVVLLNHVANEPSLEEENFNLLLTPSIKSERLLPILKLDTERKRLLDGGRIFKELVRDT